VLSLSHRVVTVTVAPCHCDRLPVSENTVIVIRDLTGGDDPILRHCTCVTVCVPPPGCAPGPGIYFGTPKGFGTDENGNRTGFNTMIYSTPEVHHCTIRKCFTTYIHCSLYVQYHVYTLCLQIRTVNACTYALVWPLLLVLFPGGLSL